VLGLAPSEVLDSGFAIGAPEGRSDTLLNTDPASRLEKQL